MAASVEMLKGYGCVAVGSLINKYTTSTRKATERQRFAVWKTIFGFLIFLSWKKKEKKKSLAFVRNFRCKCFFTPPFLQAGSACCVAVMASLPALPTQTLQDLPVSLYVNGSMGEDLVCFCLRFLGRGKMWHENYEASCFAPLEPPEHQRE